MCRAKSRSDERGIPRKLINWQCRIVRGSSSVSYDHPRTNGWFGIFNLPSYRWDEVPIVFGLAWKFDSTPDKSTAVFKAGDEDVQANEDGEEFELRLGVAVAAGVKQAEGLVRPREMRVKAFRHFQTTPPPPQDEASQVNISGAPRCNSDSSRRRSRRWPPPFRLVARASSRSGRSHRAAE